MTAFFDKEAIYMQNTVKRFVMQNSLERNEKIWYIDLVSEIGELGKEILKETDYGKKDYALNETSVEEMGDCLFSLLGLCCEMNIEAEKALKAALSKYQKRKECKGDIGSNN
ncbi:nucleotide pyrophosphohydrolase [Erysipelotrichaceae bacterium 66202529]|nr:nucleotide pyrophosphohydrolase [Erysipelotrichaceae bacterium 66202529]